MKFEEILSVSGMPGLFRMVNNRNNGLIVESLETGKRKFAPARKHQFTPLISIGIYTNDGEAVELRKVFFSMKEQLDDNPPPTALKNSAVVKEYFEDILPTYDKHRVHVADMKKVIKWFNFLNTKDVEDLYSATPA